MKKISLLLVLFFVFVLLVAAVVQARDHGAFVEKGKKIYQIITTKWVLFFGGMIMLFMFAYNAVRAGLARSNLDERYTLPIAISFSIAATLIVLISFANADIQSPDQVIDTFIFECTGGTTTMGAGAGEICLDGEFTWVGFMMGLAGALVVGGISYQFARGIFGGGN